MSDTLKLSIEIDAASGLAVIKNFRSAATSAMDATGEAAEQATQRSEHLFRTITGGALAARAIEGAFSAVSSIIRGSVGEYLAAEEADLSLQSTLSQHGMMVAGITDAYDTLADRMLHQFGVSDELVKRLAAVGIEAGVSGGRIGEMVQGALGLSESFKEFGLSQETAMKGLSQALQGNFGLLGRYIPQLSEMTSYSERMTFLQDKMAIGVKKLEASAQSSAGQLRIWKEELGNVQETWGKTIFAAVSEPMRDVQRIILDNKDEISSLLRLGGQALGVIWDLRGALVAAAAATGSIWALDKGVDFIKMVKGGNGVIGEMTTYFRVLRLEGASTFTAIWEAAKTTSGEIRSLKDLLSNLPAIAGAAAVGYGIGTAARSWFPEIDQAAQRFFQGGGNPLLGAVEEAEMARILAGYRVYIDEAKTLSGTLENLNDAGATTAERIRAVGEVTGYSGRSLADAARTILLNRDAFEQLDIATQLTIIRLVSYRDKLIETQIAQSHAMQSAPGALGLLMTNSMFEGYGRILDMVLANESLWGKIKDEYKKWEAANREAEQLFENVAGRAGFITKKNQSRLSAEISDFMQQTSMFHDQLNRSFELRNQAIETAETLSDRYYQATGRVHAGLQAFMHQFDGTIGHVRIQADNLYDYLTIFERFFQAPDLPVFSAQKVVLERLATQLTDAGLGLPIFKTLFGGDSATPPPNDPMMGWVEGYTDFLKSVGVLNLNDAERDIYNITTAWGEYGAQLRQTGDIHDRFRGNVANVVERLGFIPPELREIAKELGIVDPKYAELQRKLDLATQWIDATTRAAGSLCDILESVGAISVDTAGKLRQTVQSLGQLVSGAAQATKGVLDIESGNLIEGIPNALGGLAKIGQALKKLFSGDGVGEAMKREMSGLQSLTRDQEKAVRDLEKQYHSTHAAISVFYDQYLENVRLSGVNLAQYTSRWREIISDYHQGRLDAGQVGKEMGDSWAVLWERMQKIGVGGVTKEILQTYRDLENEGIRVAEVEKFRTEQLEGSRDALLEYLKLFDTTAALRTIDQTNEALNAGNLTLKQREELEAKLLEQEGAYSRTTDELRRNWQSMQLYTIATFSALAGRGDWSTAFLSMREDFTLLRKMAEENGLGISDTLKDLLNLSDIVEKNEPLIKQMEYLNKVIKGLGNAGYMTREVFDNFGRDILGQYDQLRSNAGMNEIDALRMIAPSLSQLMWWASQGGYQLSDREKELIELAKKSGINLEAMRTLEQIEMDAYNEQKWIHENTGNSLRVQERMLRLMEDQAAGGGGGGSGAQAAPVTWSVTDRGYSDVRPVTIMPPPALPPRIVIPPPVVLDRGETGRGGDVTVHVHMQTAPAQDARAIADALVRLLEQVPTYRDRIKRIGHG